MSGQEEGTEIDLRVVRGSVEAADGGVRHGVELVAFVDAFASRDAATLQSARDALITAVGEEGFVDAAGVVANFQQMNRIANGTGVASESALQAMSGTLRNDLDLDSFASAQNTPKLGAFTRLVSKVLSPFAKRIFRKLSK